MQLDVGFLDLMSRQGVPGRLTWYRNSRQKGSYFLTFLDEPRPRISASDSFVRAVDTVADCASVDQLYLRGNSGHELMLRGREWSVYYGLVGPVVTGWISHRFDAPHEIVQYGVQGLFNVAEWEWHPGAKRIETGGEVALGYQISQLFVQT